VAQSTLDHVSLKVRPDTTVAVGGGVAVGADVAVARPLPVLLSQALFRPDWPSAIWVAPERYTRQ
jgi:hypothetical protein